MRQKVAITISGKTYHRRLPDSFSGLTRREVLAISRYMISKQMQFGQWHNEDRWFVLSLLLRIDLEHFYELPDYHATALLQTVQSVFTDSYFPALRYVRPHHWPWVLPNKELEGMPFIQFVYAESFYALVPKGDDYLHKLVATLCTPGIHYNDRIRWVRVFTDRQLDQRAEQATNLLHEEQYAVLWFYHSCRQALVQKYPAVFRKSGDSRGMGGPDFTSKYGWSGALHVMAKEGAFGTMEQCMVADLHDVLHHLNYNSDYAREMEIKHKIKK